MLHDRLKFLRAGLLALLLLHCAAARHAEARHPAAQQQDQSQRRASALSATACEQDVRRDHPFTRIDNSKLSLTVYLPDPANGYYRGPRFDWAGIIACASLNGHSFFGEWFNRYSPGITDAVTGPVEEFRNPSSELGYDEAAPGGLFVKIGVGVLRRVDVSPYRFGADYPLVDPGKWTVKVRAHSITFRQDLHTSIGYAYRYEKTLALDHKGAVLTLSHRLRNLGSRPIDTEVYDHDFFMLDDKPTGPGLEIRLPFAPVPDKPLPSSVQIADNTIRFIAPLTPGHGVGAYLTGFSTARVDYDITIQDLNTGVGVQQTSTSPLVRFYLWATPRTVCPEAYLAIHVAPGRTQPWIIRYRFFTHPGK